MEPIVRVREPRTAPNRRTVLRRTALCTALLLAVTGCGLGSGDGSDTPSQGSRPPAGEKSAHPSPGDFNGDGFDDLATVVTAESKDRDRSRSTLVVVYGSEEGLDPDWAARTGSAIDGPTAYSWITGPLLRTDLDGDGFTDLVTSRGDDKKTQPIVLRGGPRGLSEAQPLDVPQDFRPLAAGDFDGDGSVDLVDGGLGGSGPPRSELRDVAASLQYGPFDTDGKPARSAPIPGLDQHGYATPDSATAADFDDDGRDDIVFTYSFDDEEDDSAPAGLTSVAHYRGTRQGLVRDTRPEPVLVRVLSGDDGARTPSTGDADGDGITDLLTPADIPAHPQDAPQEGGALAVLYGAKSGLDTGRKATTITGGRKADFGTSPAVGDVNGDRRPDVVVSTPSFRRKDGRITLLPGAASGTPATGGEQRVDAETEGLPGTPNPHYWNAFQHQPPLLDVNGDAHADVVVYGPLYNKRTGQFIVLPGTDKGLAPQQAQGFTPKDLGIHIPLK